MTIDEINAVLKEAGEKERDGDIVGAATLMDQLVAKYPDDQRLAEIQLRVFVRNFDPIYSRLEVAKYRAKYPNDKVAPLLEASIHLRADKPELALKILDRIQATVGLDEDGRIMKAGALMMLGRPSEAEMESLPTKSKIADAWPLLFLKLARTEEEMLAAADHCRQLNGSKSSLEAYEADWYTEHRRFEKAEAVLVKGLESFPLDPTLNHAMAKLDIARGRKAAAAKRFEEALRRVPSDAVSARWLSHYYLRRLRIRDAVRVLKTNMIEHRRLGFGPK